GADFLDLLERDRERAVARGQARQIFDKGPKLRQTHVQLRILVGDPAQILRRRLEFFQRIGGFRGDRLDDIEHLRNRFAEIRYSFAGENFAVARAAGTVVALGDVDRHFAEQPERD